MIYAIYHPADGSLNYDCDVKDVVFKPVALVEATGLDAVFVSAQNFNKNYLGYRVRSTSVGDIAVELDEESKVGRAFMALGQGWKELCKEDISVHQLK